MHLWEGVRLAMEQIRTQKLKSFFSVLGVIIGVLFLIAVVSVVEGMDQYIREDFSSQVFGVNTVTVRRRPTVEGNLTEEQRRERARRPRLRVFEAEAIRERLRLPATVAVTSDRSGDIASDQGVRIENVRLSAASAEIFQIRDLDLQAGRVFTVQEAQDGASVVVLGSETAQGLFPEEAAVGRRVRIRGRTFRVIGVLAEQGTLLGFSQDNVAIAPQESPLRSYVNPIGVVDEIIIQTDPALVAAVQGETEGIMRIVRRLRPGEESDFAVETADESLSFWNRISRILFLALPGLVAISLVVGGIVIMNIMLVSVMERTREIGVRKAIGARRRDILTQVLIESATLSGLGAAVGVAIGVGLASLVAAVSFLPAAIAAHWIVLGVTLGVGVGIAAGVYPAARAARMHPVDALRYE